MSGRESTPADSGDPERFSLRRWSQRKHAAARESNPAPAAPADSGPDLAPRGGASSADSTSLADAPRAASVAPVGVDETPPVPSGTTAAERTSGGGPKLPPVETLTIDSDFTAFMRPGVDEAHKRGALKKLFGDPRFNVMDGLDTYIDDYTKSDPVEPSLARELLSRLTFDTPAMLPAATVDPVAAQDETCEPGEVGERGATRPGSPSAPPASVASTPAEPSDMRLREPESPPEAG
ncbi:MAG: DUF3306 domain-containing protein [Betaproteobacteria bacterium]|nr:DUF3306 domain-containing protein [Betaproteobacteria bacterium]